MASIRSALRLAPRAQFVRPSTVPRTPIVAQRYASIVPRPATDAKSAAEAEQGSEDLAGMGDDPNMVCQTWEKQEQKSRTETRGEP